MHEIDHLIKTSITLIQKSNLDGNRKRNIIYNLEHIPERYDFDAGGYNKTETSSDFSYESLHVYQLGLAIVTEAQKKSHKGLIYDWTAFLLNFWQEYFSDVEDIEMLKVNYLVAIKTIFVIYQFDDYTPIHNTLTIYEDGNKWFSNEQNMLIKWFCS